MECRKRSRCRLPPRRRVNLMEGGLVSNVGGCAGYGNGTIGSTITASGVARPERAHVMKETAIADAYPDLSGFIMTKLFDFDGYSNHILAGLNPAETRELQELERVIPSLSEWNAYTMQPISEREKRWAYLLQKHIDAMKPHTTLCDNCGRSFHYGGAGPDSTTEQGAAEPAPREPPGPAGEY